MWHFGGVECLILKQKVIWVEWNRPTGTKRLISAVWSWTWLELSDRRGKSSHCGVATLIHSGATGVKPGENESWKFESQNFSFLLSPDVYIGCVIVLSSYVMLQETSVKIIHFMVERSLKTTSTTTTQSATEGTHSHAKDEKKRRGWEMESEVAYVKTTIKNF